MSTRKVAIGILGASVAAATLLVGSVIAAPDVPYGAPLPPAGGGGPGGPGGGGGRGFGGRGGFAIGQIATVTGSSFTITSTFDGSTTTIKTKPTTEFIKSTAGTLDDIKVGDTIQVGGRPDESNNITARRITDGTVGTGGPGGGPGPGGAPPGAGGPPPGGAPPAGGPPPGGGGFGGGGGGGRRGGGITGVVTILDPLTFKTADGTVYTVDTSNNPQVSLNTTGTISDIVVGKYVQVQGAPPATPPAAGAPGTPIAPPTSITAQRITVSDTAPRFGRPGGGGGGGGGGFGGGGGAGAGAGGAAPAVQ